MNKILNWTVGSFFRTIGRIVAYLGIGLLIAYIFSNSDINWGIKDLFFDRVDALGFSMEVKQSGSAYIDYSNINQSTWSAEPYGYVNRFSSSATSTVQEVVMEFTSPLNSTSIDFVAFPFMVSQPTRNLQQNNEVANVWCDTWYGITDSAGHQQFTCQNWNTEYSTNYQPFQQEITNFNFYFNVEYIDDNGNWAGWNSCDMDSGTIMCPTTRKKIKKLHIFYLFVSPDTTYSNMFIGGGIRFYNFNDAASAVHEQTQQQQQQHNETQSYLEDSNTTQAESEATEFFNDFQVEDHGGLSGIITAPLSTIQGLLNNTCTNLVLPLPFVNENLTLPCMSSIYTQHFGAFFSIYQTIILAIISYRCLRSLFYDVRGFINPDDDRIEVMDL